MLAAPRVEDGSRTEPVRTGKHTVHWFRKGLRLHDNPGLIEGLNGAETLRCVYIIDPYFVKSNIGINKWSFLLQCLEDLDNSLKKFNSRLFVVRGQPVDALPKLFQEWGTTVLTFEEDPEPYGRVRDYNIMCKCLEVGVAATSRVSHTLYKLDNIIELNGGKAPMTYDQFHALIARLPPPPPAEPPISAQMFEGTVTPVAEDHDKRFGVPTLEELGFEIERLKPSTWIGGETEALDRLERHLEWRAWVACSGTPKLTPESFLASKTGLSPYLRFGCLSTRLFYSRLMELYIKIKKCHPPLSLHGQILCREFLICTATQNLNFDRMEGNLVCVKIPRDKNQEALSKWANGQTGFPWIDATMIQLRNEGWIHNISRHAVTCFLMRRDIRISWEEGMEVFDELLLDVEGSVNASMWMWLNCSLFCQQFFHCYCPVSFGRKVDPNGHFIRKHIPALQNMSTQYVHEPWLAPQSVQLAAGCIVGRDYPMPMVDHAEASQANMERIKQDYAQLTNYISLGSIVRMATKTTLNSNTHQDYLHNQTERHSRSMQELTHKDVMSVLDGSDAPPQSSKESMNVNCLNQHPSKQVVLVTLKTNPNQENYIDSIPNSNPRSRIVKMATPTLISNTQDNYLQNQTETLHSRSMQVLTYKDVMSVLGGSDISSQSSKDSMHVKSSNRH